MNNQKPSTPPTDSELVEQLRLLTNVLNTTGWWNKKHLIAKVRKAVFMLEDAGLDLAANAILKHFGAVRHSLDSVFPVETSE